MEKDRTINPGCRKIIDLSIAAKFLPCLLFLIAAAGQSAYSQQKTAFEVNNATLDQALRQVRDVTGYFILYNVEDVEGVTGLNIRLTDAGIDLIMSRCLENTGLAYEIRNNTVIISKKTDSGSITVKGAVSDSDGRPLPGATVMLKGAGTGTVTKPDGTYSITVPANSSMTLVFSFIGMNSVEVAIGQRRDISVSLTDLQTLIKQVVVTGYKEMAEKSMVGSYSRIDARDLFNDGTRTLPQMMQGALPGLMVINRSGLTGTRQKVRVRGTSTLWGNPEPVWVVDGVIQEDPIPFDASQVSDLFGANPDMIKEFIGGAVSWLNPNDIEDVTVLKDASATAIYGVKAANGVIVITTRKGERGAASVSYSGAFSVTPRLNYNRLNRMNSAQRVDASREAYEKGYLLNREDQFGYMAAALAYRRNEITLDEFNARVRKLETQNTDWFGKLFINAVSQNHSVGVSGGAEKTTYRVSLGYSDVNNTTRGNSQNQYTGNINISTGLWDQVTINARISGSHSKTRSFAGENPYKYAYSASRTLPDANPDGTRYFYKMNGYDYNILNELANSGNRNQVSSLNSSLNMRWFIAHYLTFTGTYSYNTSNAFGELWYSEESNQIAAIRGYDYNAYLSTDREYKASPLPHGGSLSTDESRNMNYTLRNQLDFNMTFDLKHVLTASVGQEIRSNKYDGFTSMAYGYMPGRGKIFVTVPLYTTPISVDNPSTSPNSLARSTHTVIDRKSNYLSWYGTANYVYDNRYAIDASVRMDASNRFGQDRNARFQPVWSVGARWNVTNEAWMQDQKLFNDVSVKISYGFQGNVAENVGPDLIARITPATDGSGDYNLAIQSLPAPQLKWEKTRSFGFGVNFSLLGSRLNGNFDYYSKKTTDMIIEREVTLENGVRNRLFNGGDMANSGWDLGFNFIPVRNNDFVWAVGMNVSKVKNTLKTQIEPLGTWEEAVSGNLNKKGYAVSSFWAWQFLGVDPQNGAPLFGYDAVAAAGADMDATKYLAYAGKTDPDFTAGFNTSLRYKTLTLSANFYLSTGNRQFLMNPYETSNGGIPNEYTNMSGEWLDRWRKPGDKTDIPALPDPVANNPTHKVLYGGVKEGTFRPYDLYPYSTVRVVDAWYLRCNNISLSCSVPERWTGGFARYVSAGFSVSNPFQLASRDFGGRDPEVARGNQPLSRVYSLSVNMNF